MAAPGFALVMLLVAGGLAPACERTPGRAAPGGSTDAATCNGDLASDPDNCGSCGAACVLPPHTISVGCARSRCELVQCQAGFADCNQRYADGCEVDLFASIAQCGQCGHTCPTLPDAVSSVCVRPQGCEVGQCRPGFGDCDGSAINGCEARLDSDVANCGGCGAPCGAHAATYPSCSGGTCSYACANERYDVDGSLVNGCETQDFPLGNHAQPRALLLGGATSCDGGAFTNQIVGALPSDRRGHPDLAIRNNHSVEDWYAIAPRGETGCSRDLNFQLITAGRVAGVGDCFQATFITSQGRFAVHAASGGVATLGNRAAAYTVPSTIYVVVEKLTEPEDCAAPIDDNVVYFINYHL
jgi:hypothetical protein